MIRKQFLIPECYINKIPICDDCQEILQNTGVQLLTSPPKYQLVCPKCSKSYTFNESELKGEWKWKTI